jgi:hypothetical protein
MRVESFMTQEPLESDASVRGAKPPYVSPKLTEYGPLTDLTRAVDLMGAADGGMFFMQRT